MRQIFIIFICLSILDICSPPTANAQGMVADSIELAALQALFDSTNGTTWRDNTGWINSSSITGRYGVRVENGDIIGITLKGDSLSGNIPSEIGNLTQLVSLDLERNQIEGSIPESIGNLAKLRLLRLGANKLEGSIPAKLWTLDSLRILNLASNNLTRAIPTEIGNLKKLTAISLSNNPLGGKIPSSIGMLKELRDLRLNSCELTGNIPTEIGGLDSLRILGLVDNQLNGAIPASIGMLTKLENLVLNKNNLSDSIPSTLWQLINLDDLRLWGNPELTGIIPSEVGNLTKLVVLWISSTKLTGSIPEEIGKLTKLRLLYLNNNNLVGQIPSSIGNLINLEGLLLDRNQLEEAIPKSIENLKELEVFEAFNNQLSGTIPSEIGKLDSLKRLRLENNLLEDSIPKTIGDLTELVTLRLDNNQLTGTIPSEIGNLNKLEVLNLFLNQLEGSIPLEIGNLDSLIALKINNNQLSGSIPSVVEDLSKLKTLELQANNFTGSLPSKIGQLSNLTTLFISNNQLSGNIPIALRSLKDSLIFELRNNKYEFGALEPFFFPDSSSTIKRIAYIPQSDIGDTLIIPVNFGQTMRLDSDIDGDSTSYEWLKLVNGSFQILENQTSKFLNLTNINLGDIGVYSCRATNSIVPNLILRRAPIILTLFEPELSYRLIDAETDQVITTLEDSLVINLDTLSSSNLSIEIVDASNQTQSVKMNLSGAITKTSIENVAPFALFGNIGDDFVGREFMPGTYTIEGTAYTEQDLAGAASQNFSVSFRLVTNKIINSLSLVNAQVDTIIGALKDGDIIDLAIVGDSLNILANTTPNRLGSILFRLNGKDRDENIPPYALFGNSGSDFFSRPLVVGEYTLTVVAFSKVSLKGEALDTLSIQFTVIDSDTAVPSSKSILYQNEPNPFNQSTIIQAYISPNVQEAILYFYDEQGNMIKKTSLNQREDIAIPLDASGLKEGLYFYKLFIDGKEIGVKRMMIER